MKHKWMKKGMQKRICAGFVAVAMAVAGVGCGGEKIQATKQVEAADQSVTTEKQGETNTAQVETKTEDKEKSDKTTLEVVAENAYEGEVPEYTITYKEGNYGSIGIIEFDWEGHSYEMCLAGLPCELEANQIKTIIGGFISGEVTTITGNGIVDAEKQSNKVAFRNSNSVTDKYGRDETDWGDSLLCWAAVSSNMLVMSGWAGTAKAECEDKELAKELTNEDSIFNYFDDIFINDGYYVYDGLVWFFDGDQNDERLFETGLEGKLEKYNYKDYIQSVSFSEKNAERNNDLSEIACATTLISELKEGGAVGVDIMINRFPYTPKKKACSVALYSEERGGFVTYASIDVAEDDPNIVEAYYSYNNDGTIVKLEKTGDGYASEDGNNYDELNVYTGTLYRLDSGEYIKVNNEDSRYTATYYVNCDEADIDMDSQGRCMTIDGEGHALTVSGYVIDKSERSDASKVKALFITDSDNDAGYYVLDDDNADRTKRPNSMTLYMTELVENAEGTETLNIVNYIKHADAPVKKLTVLKSKH